MQPTMITGGETVLHANLLTTTGQRLTPTGKISHAKTRVYTQRYRKEWEQMPDFKGTTRLQSVAVPENTLENVMTRDIAARRSRRIRATLDTRIASRHGLK